MRPLAPALLLVAAIASCDFSASFLPKCLNDRIPYTALTDTIALIHCSTVDSLVLHRDTTRTTHP